MYEIEFTSASKRQFLKLDKSVQERIGSVLERIKIRPEHFLEKLVGEPGYKLRVGDYRLILEVIHDKLMVLVLEVGHRRNIYKR